ncbi:MAG: hypothetical protein KIT87_17840 [Anaerolineae bacterium]|nr:hypothetical protein [Anaerolineae bacterium]
MKQVQEWLKGSRVGRDVVAIFALWALAALFVAPALPPDRTLLPLDMLSDIEPWAERFAPPPHNTLLSDVIFENLPDQMLVSASVRRGELPLWDPHALLGRPLMGDPNAQPFYPVSYALAWLPAPRAMTLAALFHLALAGSLMYALLRTLGAGRLGAWLAGSVYMLNGVFVVWLEYPPFLASGAWIPGALLGYEWAVRRRQPLFAALGGLALALSLLGGQVQYPLLTGLLLTAYAVVLAIHTRQARWPLGLLAVQGVVALAGAAAQLVATWLVLPYSARAFNDYEALLGTRLPWSDLVLLVAPNFFGNPVHSSYWGRTNYNEQTVYFGLAPLLLALVAPIVRRSRVTLFWSGVALVALLWVTGTPLLHLADLVPGLGYFNLPRLLYLFPLCGAILAGLALDSLNRYTVRWLAGVGAVVALAYLAALAWYTVGHQSGQPGTLAQTVGPVVWLALSVALAWLGGRRWQWRPLLVAVAVADLFVFGCGYNPVTPVELAYPNHPLVERLRDEQTRERHRIAPLQAHSVLLGPNVPGALGLDEVGGYTSLPPARLRRLFEYAENYVSVPWMNVNSLMLQFSQVRPRLLGMLNVKYFLATNGPSLPEFEGTHTCAGDSGPIWGGRRVGQSFSAVQNGLHRVDVRVSRLAGSRLRLRVESDDDPANIVGAQDIDGDGLPDGKPATVYFSPVPGSATRRFTIWLDAPDATPDTAPTVCLSATSLGRTAQRLENDSPVDGNLALAAYSVPTNFLRRRATIDHIRIYHNPGYLPRAYIVHAILPVADEAEALQTLFHPAFDPETEAVVETPPPPGFRLDTPAPATRVEMLDYRAQSVTLRAHLDRPGLLVLTDQYFPGWEATANDRPTPIVRVNDVVRGVYLDTGDTIVVFRFRPWPVYAGLAVSLLVWGLIALWLLRAYRQRSTYRAPTDCAS